MEIHVINCIPVIVITFVIPVLYNQETKSHPDSFLHINDFYGGALSNSCLEWNKPPYPTK